MTRGWKREGYRHGMARKGIKTRGMKSLLRSVRKKYPSKKNNLHFLVWYTPIQREHYNYEEFQKIQKDLAKPYYRNVEIWVRDGEYGEHLASYTVTDEGEFEIINSNAKKSRGMEKLKYEGYAKEGETIRAYDFPPVTSRPVSFIEGVVLDENASMPSQPDAKAYAIRLTRKIFAGKEITNKMGEVYYVPHETFDDTRLYEEEGINRVSIVRRN